MSPFDHAVINCQDRMDEAVQVFQRLGFQLTERGFHTLGSINHTLVFGSTYLELIGYPAGQMKARSELAGTPIGVNGLVWRSDDALVTYRQQQALGTPVNPAQHFSRPVRLGETVRDAAFQTVRLQPGAAQAGRFYFCQHLTPDLVWRDEWRRHDNGAIELLAAQLELRSDAPDVTLLDQMLGPEAVAVESGAGGDYRHWYAPPLRISAKLGAAQSRMLGLTFRVASAERAAACLRASGVVFQAQAQTLQIAPEHAFGAALSFVEI